MNRVRYGTGAVIVGAVMAWAATNAPAAAGICASTTSCTLYFTQGNSSSGFGTGSFGKLDLSLAGNTVTATIDVTAGGMYLIDTGFPGTTGFFDSIGGGLTIGNFSDAAFSGSISATPPYVATGPGANLSHFDGFGYANDVAGTTAPHAGASTTQVLSFDVTGALLTDVNDLVNLFSPVGGDGAVYWVADVYCPACSDGVGATGLIAVTGAEVPPPPHIDTPEPGTLSVIGVGLAMFGMAVRSRRKGR